MWGGLVAALAWSYTAVIRRVVTRTPVPGLLLLGVVGITARTLVALVSGSVFVYFLQPTLTTVLVGAVFLVSVPAGPARWPIGSPATSARCRRPSSARRPCGGSSPASPSCGRSCSSPTPRCSLWLLATQSIETYVFARTVLSWALTGGAVLASTLYFKRSMRRHGITIHWRTAARAA